MIVAPAVVGRERELRVIEDILDGVHARGTGLLIHGEPGIGKSALVTAAIQAACERGFRVLATTGVQSETHLPFAGLHQLLRPILTGADDLPPRQRDSLLAAFGMADATAPDFFLIALAVLELAAGAAARSPLLLVAEDAQWLDMATCDVLAFVARRVQSEPIIIIAAIREGFEQRLRQSWRARTRSEAAR